MADVFIGDVYNVRFAGRLRILTPNDVWQMWRLQIIDEEGALISTMRIRRDEADEIWAAFSAEATAEFESSNQPTG